MSQIDYNEEVVSWSIDRRPYYDTQSSQDTINDETSDILEATDYLVEYEMTTHHYELDNRSRRVETYYNEIEYDYANNDIEEFIPFGNHDKPKPNNNSPINFVIYEFELSEEDKNCCICLCDRNNDQMCSLNCRHTFCAECINIHLNTNQTCPLCRTDIIQIQTKNIEARQKFHH
jgi:hypothetical protein